MQDLKPTQMTQSQQEEERSNHSTQPVYMRPQIEMFKEEDLLKRVNVWGCSIQAPGP